MLLQKRTSVKLMVITLVDSESYKRGMTSVKAASLWELNIRTPYTVLAIFAS